MTHAAPESGAQDTVPMDGLDQPWALFSPSADFFKQAERIHEPDDEALLLSSITYHGRNVFLKSISRGECGSCNLSVETIQARFHALITGKPLNWGWITQLKSAPRACVATYFKIAVDYATSSECILYMCLHAHKDLIPAFCDLAKTDLGWQKPALNVLTVPRLLEACLCANSLTLSCLVALKFGPEIQLQIFDAVRSAYGCTHMTPLLTTFLDFLAKVRDGFRERWSGRFKVLALDHSNERKPLIKCSFFDEQQVIFFVKYVVRVISDERALSHIKRNFTPNCAANFMDAAFLAMRVYMHLFYPCASANKLTPRVAPRAMDSLVREELAYAFLFQSIDDMSYQRSQDYITSTTSHLFWWQWDFENLIEKYDPPPPPSFRSEAAFNEIMSGLKERFTTSKRVHAASSFKINSFIRDRPDSMSFWLAYKVGWFMDGLDLTPVGKAFLRVAPGILPMLIVAHVTEKWHMPECSCVDGNDSFDVLIRAVIPPPPPSLPSAGFLPADVAEAMSNHFSVAYLNTPSVTGQFWKYSIGLVLLEGPMHCMFTAFASQARLASVDVLVDLFFSVMVTVNVGDDGGEYLPETLLKLCSSLHDMKTTLCEVQPEVRHAITRRSTWCSIAHTLNMDFKESHFYAFTNHVERVPVTINSGDVVDAHESASLYIDPNGRWSRNYAGHDPFERLEVPGQYALTGDYIDAVLRKLSTLAAKCRVGKDLNGHCDQAVVLQLISRMMEDAAYTDEKAKAFLLETCYGKRESLYCERIFRFSVIHAIPMQRRQKILSDEAFVKGMMEKHPAALLHGVMTTAQMDKVAGVLVRKGNISLCKHLPSTVLKSEATRGEALRSRNGQMVLWALSAGLDAEVDDDARATLSDRILSDDQLPITPDRRNIFLKLPERLRKHRLLVKRALLLFGRDAPSIINGKSPTASSLATGCEFTSLPDDCGVGATIAEILLIAHENRSNYESEICREHKELSFENVVASQVKSGDPSCVSKMPLCAARCKFLKTLHASVLRFYTTDVLRQHVPTDSERLLKKATSFVKMFDWPAGLTDSCSGLHPPAHIDACDDDQLRFALSFAEELQSALLEITAQARRDDAGTISLSAEATIMVDGINVYTPEIAVEDDSGACRKLFYGNGRVVPLGDSLLKQLQGLKGPFVGVLHAGPACRDRIRRLVAGKEDDWTGVTIVVYDYLAPDMETYSDLANRMQNGKTRHTDLVDFSWASYAYRSQRNEHERLKELKKKCTHDQHVGVCLRTPIERANSFTTLQSRFLERKAYDKTATAITEFLESFVLNVQSRCEVASLMDADAPPLTLASFKEEASKAASEMLHRKSKKTSTAKIPTTTSTKRKAPLPKRAGKLGKSKSVTYTLALLSKRHKAANQADSSATARPTDAGPSSSRGNHVDHDAPVVKDGSDDSDASMASDQSDGSDESD
jgi:hypothetical protein